jgi:outer membrane protein OmpA-like peptidoglycan-associated protein
MQSRQIQIFGLIGAAILILFIVIFLGKDFHKLYLEYLQSKTLPTLKDDQVVMDAHAVKVLEEKLDEESESVLAEYKTKSVDAEGSVNHARSVTLNDSRIVNERSREAEDKPKKPLVVHKTDSVSNINDRHSKDNIAIEVEKKANHENILQSVSKVLPVTNVQKERVAKPLAASDTTVLNRAIHQVVEKGAFFHNGLSLTQQNRDILDNVIEKIKELGSGYSVEVEGHTKRGLAKSYSKQMASETANYLQKGLPGVVIKSVGYGDEYPVIDDLEDVRNTRIEIIVRRSE